MKNSNKQQHLNFQSSKRVILGSQAILASKKSFEINQVQKMSITSSNHQPKQQLPKQQIKGQKIDKQFQSQRISKASQYPKTINQKMKTLHRVKYINQLAQLDYEQKAGQIYTKHSKVSKQTLMKKIKAKNQMASFIEEQNDLEQDFNQLIDYKYGKNTQYHFQQQQKQDYTFCQNCDSIHNDQIILHGQICPNYAVLSNNYFMQSFQRIKSALKKLNSIQAEQIYCLINRIAYKQKTAINKFKQIQQINKNDKILNKICLKIEKILQL